MFFKNKFKNFAKRTPPAVSKIKATSPMARIIRVLTFKKASADMVPPIVIPSKIVTRFESSFCAEIESLSRTPQTLIKLPNIKAPIRDTDIGAIIPAITVITIGNNISTFFGT